MHIHLPKDWELPDSAVTPESLYWKRNRRSFFKTAGLGLAGAVLLRRSVFGATTGFPAKPNGEYDGTGLKITPYEFVTNYNNFYEFGTGKDDPAKYANQTWKPEPGWTIEIGGMAGNPGKWDVEDLVAKMGGIEQRVYRHRCVEAWSMVIPWDGFPLARLIAFGQPKAGAKFVDFTSFLDTRDAPGQSQGNLDYPYVEGLTMAEAMNELAFLATGIFGKPLPNQNGAPIRLVTPWKYGFKGIKSIVRIEFSEKPKPTTWNKMAPEEYGFFANVNPHHDHPRWSQASETVIGSGFFARHQPTLMFNGYGKQVAALYAGMDLDKYF